MYFDIKPKTNVEDLFGVNFLLSLLVNAIKDKKVRMIVIKGLRRTGKTSLLNVALKEAKIDYIKIDIREAPYYDRAEFFEFLIAKLEEKYSKLKKLLEGAEIKIFYKDVGAGLKLKDKKTISFLEELNTRLKKRNKQLIIALDEAQLLRKIEFNQVLASIYDNYENIKLIITGSEIGILDGFIGKRDAKSPLFGRPYFEIEMKKLEKEKSAEFLERGFKQINKQLELKEAEEIIEELDGIIGWLTAYGWFRNQNINHRNALMKTIEEGKKLAKEELSRFLDNRKARASYIFLLKLLAKNEDSWGIIKNEFVRRRKKISDRQLSLYIRELIDYGFIEKDEDKYKISDPLHMRAVED